MMSDQPPKVVPEVFNKANYWLSTRHDMHVLKASLTIQANDFLLCLLSNLWKLGLFPKKVDAISLCDHLITNQLYSLFWEMNLCLIPYLPIRRGEQKVIVWTQKQVNYCFAHNHSAGKTK